MVRLDFRKERLVIKIIKKSILVQELKKLEIRDGLIDPKAVVREATPKDSPLHEAFEWEDNLAAEQWRLYQARSLVNSVSVEILGKKQDAFHSVVVEISGERTRGYVSTERMIRDEDLKAQVKAVAVKEIKYWQDKYKEIEELDGLINEEKLDEIVKVI